MRTLLAGVVLVVAGVGAGYLWREAQGPTLPPAGAPVVRQNQPGPGGPPVLWVSGTIREVTPERITLQDGDGPTLEIGRFAAGATRFHRLAAGAWGRVPPASAADAVGRRACVEALFDDGDLLAVRVFLGAACSPVPGP